MQNRYAGDVGDYVKLGLLRALSPGRRLGVAWYLHPDEAHNSDGRHTAYLSDPERWRHLDPDLFDALGRLVAGTRSVAGIERAGIIDATFHKTEVPSEATGRSTRASDRSRWFVEVEEALRPCDLVFADPDNGLVDDGPERPGDRKHAKQIPLQEALALARGRPALIYHHNTRFKGGHDREVEHWLSLLGQEALAVRASAFSCRTFFILNPDEVSIRRVERFCTTWAAARVRLDTAPILSTFAPVAPAHR